MRILPHGLDALLEKMVARAATELSGLGDIVEDTPKVLDSVKGNDLLEVLAPVAHVCPLPRVIVPHSPRIVQRVLDIEVIGIG